MAGVGGLREVEFDVGGLEALVVADGQVHHIEPLAVVEQGVFFLQGVAGRHHEPQFVQVGMFQHIFRNNQMPNVNGVEGSEIESCFDHFPDG